MRIAILGTGRVGSALGTGWAARGHTVVFGSRRPAQVSCSVGNAETFAGAAGRSQVVVLAVPYEVVGDVVAAAGDLSGRVVADATNPMGQPVAGGGSGAERVASLAPGAHVVKAFNTMGFETMASPVIEGRAALALMAGDDVGAKEVVASLARDLGFDAVDAGRLTAARHLESLAELWVHLAMRAGLGRDMAFALLRR